MKKHTRISPFLKWVGGKRQLLNQIIPLLPPSIETYCEPFIGGGALFFHLQPAVAYINDINPELVRVYHVIKNDVESLIQALEPFKNEAAFFYAIRDWDRDAKKYATLSEVEKAARILYLNKTCYNGLFRVNRAGQFNAPFGRYKKPNIVNASILRTVSAYMNGASIQLSCADYAQVLENLPNNAFVYLDPPYDPVSDSANFTGYAKGGFSRTDQIRLRECCDSLHKRGVQFMLSNSATDFIREQYAAYSMITVQAKRTINAHASKRGAIDEVIIRNYA